MAFEITRISGRYPKDELKSYEGKGRSGIQYNDILTASQDDKRWYVCGFQENYSYGALLDLEHLSVGLLIDLSNIILLLMLNVLKYLSYDMDIL